MSRLESMQLTPPPGIAPNTELLSMNMNKLNTTVEDVKGKIQILEKHAEQTIGRTGDLEMKSQFVAKSVQEIQGTTTALNIEIEQLKLNAVSAAVGGNIGNIYTSNDNTFGQTVGGAAFGQNVVVGNRGVVGVDGNANVGVQQADPWFGQTIGQPRTGIIGSEPVAAAAPSYGATSGTQYFNTGTPNGHAGPEGEFKRTNDRWKLYDEKFILPPVLATNKYDGRKPLEWL